MATLVVHVNAFSGKIQGGYMMVGGKRVGPMMTTEALLRYLSHNLQTRCEFLRV